MKRMISRRPVRLLPLMLSVVFAGCGDRVSTVLAPVGGFAPGAAAAAVLDGATGGNSRFYFLPPLVGNPKVNGTNDSAPFEALRVEVCVLSAGACAGAPIATFLPSAPGGRGLRLIGNHYEATWTAVCTPAASDFRLTVFAGVAELGHADASVVDCKPHRTPTADYIAFRSGQAVVIPFVVGAGLARSLAVSPASLILGIGAAGSLSATAEDYAGNPAAGTVAWTTSNAAVATVDAAGLVTGVGAGSATITASLDGLTASAAVTVRSPVTAIALTPSSPVTLASGGSVALLLSATDANGYPVTAGVTPVWTSSAPTRVSVTSSAGAPLSATASAVSPGTATITVSIPGTSLSRSVTITVLAPPIQATAGVQQTLSAASLLGPGVPLTDLTWTSSNPSVFTVTPEGVVTPMGVGTSTVTVTAHLASGDLSGGVQLTSVLPGWCTIRADIAISPSFLVLMAGDASRQLSATLPAGLPAGTALAWSSGVSDPVNPPPFTLSSTGLVTPLRAGIGSVNVAVPGTLVYGTSCITVIGTTPPVTATPSAVRIRSLPSTLYISPAGVFGSATATAEVVDAAGNVIPGSYQFQWTTGNPAVLSVNGTGGSAVVTAVAGGSASVTAAVALPAGNLSGSQQVTVTDQRAPLPGPGTITITSSASGTLYPGETAVLTLTASGAQPNASDILWTSAAPSWLAIVGPTTGPSITVRNTGTVPRATTVQVNANVVANGIAGAGSIGVAISP